MTMQYLPWQSVASHWIYNSIRNFVFAWIWLAGKLTVMWTCTVFTRTRRCHHNFNCIFRAHCNQLRHLRSLRLIFSVTIATISIRIRVSSPVVGCDSNFSHSTQDNKMRIIMQNVKLICVAVSRASNYTEQRSRTCTRARQHDFVGNSRKITTTFYTFAKFKLTISIIIKVNHKPRFSSIRYCSQRISANRKWCTSIEPQLIKKITSRTKWRQSKSSFEIVKERARQNDANSFRPLKFIGREINLSLSRATDRACDSIKKKKILKSTTSRI